MKKVLLFLGLGSLLLGTVFIASCQQEENPAESEANFSETTAELIERAKAYFENTAADLTLPGGMLVSSEGIVTRSATDGPLLIPQWDKAAPHPAGPKEVLEVPIQHGSGMKASVVRHRPGNEPNHKMEEVHSRLMFTQDPISGEIAYKMVTFISEKRFSAAHSHHISQVSSAGTGDKFSGMIIYSTVEGEILSGGKYLNGKKTHNLNIHYHSDQEADIDFHEKTAHDDIAYAIMPVTRSSDDENWDDKWIERCERCNEQDGEHENWCAYWVCAECGGYSYSCTCDENPEPEPEPEPEPNPSNCGHSNCTCSSCPGATCGCIIIPQPGECTNPDCSCISCACMPFCGCYAGDPADPRLLGPDTFYEGYADGDKPGNYGSFWVGWNRNKEDYTYEWRVDAPAEYESGHSSHVIDIWSAWPSSYTVEVTIRGKYSNYEETVYKEFTVLKRNDVPSRAVVFVYNNADEPYFFEISANDYPYPSISRRVLLEADSDTSFAMHLDRTGNSRVTLYMESTYNESWYFDFYWNGYFYSEGSQIDVYIDGSGFQQVMNTNQSSWSPYNFDWNRGEPRPFQ